MTETAFPEVENPVITLVITCHQRKQYLKSAIDSAVHQSFPRTQYEILVVADFNDAEIGEHCKVNNVEFIFDPRHGIGTKMAIGIERAAGEIICFLNDDDLFCENKLSTIFNYFRESPDTVYIHNNSLRINASGDIINNEPVSNQSQIYKIDDKVSTKWVMKSFRNYMMFNDSSISIRKSYYYRHISVLFDVYGNQDNILFYLGLLFKNNLIFIPNVLTYFRLNESGSSYLENSNKMCELTTKRLLSFHRTLQYLNNLGIRGNVYNLVFSELRTQYLINLILLCNHGRNVQEPFSMTSSFTGTYIWDFRRLALYILFLLAKVFPSFSSKVLTRIYK